jgi:beta-galactosidase
MNPFRKDVQSTANTGGVAVGRRDTLKGLAALAMTPIISQTADEAQEIRLRQATAPAVVEAGKRDQRFDDGWRFLRGDAPGAEAPGYNDNHWRVVNLPHDWSVEDLPLLGSAENGEGALWGTSVVPTRIGPFDTEVSEGGRDTGWFVGGNGWYRRHFSANAVPDDGQVEITFDGVYRNSDVWLNGVLLGTHPYGYTTFSYDLTPHLRRNGDNVLAVRVRNVGKNSRWYSGSGIYRHVWLGTTGKIRIPTWGVFVTTPEVNRSSATVNVAVKVENRTDATQDVTVRVRLFDSANIGVGTQESTQAVAPSALTEVEQSIGVQSPKLWSPSTPQMYRVEAELVSGGKTVDRMVTLLGIRKIEVDAQRGLRINGEVTKLKGGCMHHDNGLLGSCAYDRAEERKVELMKANGFNAIRTSHNPPSPMFLAACDRLGMLVMVEAFDQWEAEKNPNDYHLDFPEWWQRDLTAMILRDRNHPSVIMWSIGNEIPERIQPRGIEIARDLSSLTRKLDPTRPVTAAINNFRGDAVDPAFQHLDVGGYNYMIASYERDHAKNSERVIVGTESFPRQAFASWDPVENFPYVIGDFVWTGMDYLGESSIGNAQVSAPPRTPGGAGSQATQQAQAAGAFGGTAGTAVPSPGSGVPVAMVGGGPGGFPLGGSPISLPFPWFNAYCGDIDLIGDTKPQGYYRRVLWGNSKLEMIVQRPVPAGKVEIVSGWGWSDELRSWTWPGFEGRNLKVRVASRGDQVQLLLNGKEVGTKSVSRSTEMKVEFDVPYIAGELRAVALQNGKQIAEQSLTTTGAPYRLRLKADKSSLRPDRNELSFVKLQVIDQAGNLVPDAVVPITFSVSGVGDLAAAGTANPKDAASFRSQTPKTFHGSCLAIIQPSGRPGRITVKAQSPGLGSEIVQLNVT